jgi:hypothetical protein
MTTDIVHVSTTGKQLAVIEDLRPWHVRVWDSTGCEEWEQHVLFALQHGHPGTLLILTRELEESDPQRWAVPARHRHASVHEFDADIMARPTPRRRG